MERKYIFWHSPTGGAIGCLAVMVAIIGAVLLGGLLKVRPLTYVAILAPIAGLILYMSIYHDRKRDAGGPDRSRRESREARDR